MFQLQLDQIKIMQNCCQNQALKEQLTGINIYQKSIERQNPYLDYLVDPNFQRANRFFVLSF